MYLCCIFLLMANKLNWIEFLSKEVILSLYSRNISILSFSIIKNETIQTF